MMDLRNRDYDFPVIVREATAADEVALEALAAASPDGGAVTFRREHAGSSSPRCRSAGARPGRRPG
jgi:hypothetical protein